MLCKLWTWAEAWRLCFPVPPTQQLSLHPSFFSASVALFETLSKAAVMIGVKWFVPCGAGTFSPRQVKSASLPCLPQLLHRHARNSEAVVSKV